MKNVTISHEDGSAPRICDIDAIRARGARDPALARHWHLIEVLATAVCAKGGADVFLTGSLANMTADAYSDVDLEVICDSPATRSRIRLVVANSLAKAGTMVAQFPATHIQMPQLLIHFLDIDGALVKVDVHYVLAAQQAGAVHGMRLVGRATQRTQDADQAATNAPDPEFFSDLHQKFVGWMWYTHTKIERGEYWEAIDAMDTMRLRALMPALQLARDLPLEGYRRVEQRLSGADQARLSSTRCSSHLPNELRRALDALTDFFDESMVMVVQKLGTDVRHAKLAQMRMFIAPPAAA